MNEKPKGATPLLANHTKKVINMAMDVQKFTGAVVSIVVVVIIAVSVLVPIVATNQVKDDLANADSINAMLNIIPLLVIVGIIIAVVALFLGKKDAE